MKTITKKALIDRIADETGQKRIDVKKTVQRFLDLVIDELGEGNRLEFRDFGVFEVRERAARTAQNPKTLERVRVPARHTAKFKVGRKMKEALERLDETTERRLEVTVADGVSNATLASHNGKLAPARS
ncbi:MAG: HU family DNA-binding protein [Phycisphaerales bacterium]